MAYNVEEHDWEVREINDCLAYLQTEVIDFRVSRETLELLPIRGTPGYPLLRHQACTPAGKSPVSRQQVWLWLTSS